MRSLRFKRNYLAAAASLLIWLASAAIALADECTQTQRNAVGDSWSAAVELRDQIYPGGPPGGWYVTVMHASLLPDGKVLLMGARRRSPNFCARESGVTFTLDPDAFSGRVEPLDDARREPDDTLFCGGHAPLADGRLLATGGEHFRPQEDGLPYGRLHDPAAGWSQIPHDMVSGNWWYPTVTRLADNTMLISGGFFYYPGKPKLSIELFDPAAHDEGGMPWSQLISHEQSRWPEIGPTLQGYTHVLLLPEPVDAGGAPRQLTMTGARGRVHLFNHTDAFDDSNDRFTIREKSLRPLPAGDNELELRGEGSSSVVLSDGSIMIVGGSQDPVLGQRADVYDPATDQWRCHDTRIGRHHPTAVLLPDRTVLAINGHPERGYVGDARAPQTIDPGTGLITKGAAWPDAEVRGYHNIALLLPDGRVLVGGGLATGAEVGCERTDLRIYSPAYLADPDVRPEITSVSPVMSRAQSYPVEYSRGPIHRATLIALGSMTHSFDMNQRHVELGLEDNEGQISITVPAERSRVPAGYYMLFLLHRAEVQGVELDVPSPAAIVQIVDEDARHLR